MNIRIEWLNSEDGSVTKQLVCINMDVIEIYDRPQRALRILHGLLENEEGPVRILAILKGENG